MQYLVESSIQLTPTGHFEYASIKRPNKQKKNKGLSINVLYRIRNIPSDPLINKFANNIFTMITRSWYVNGLPEEKNVFISVIGKIPQRY